MESRAFSLKPCSSSSSSSKIPQEIEEAEDARSTGIDPSPLFVKKKKRKRGIIVSKPKLGHKFASSSSSSSSWQQYSRERVKQWDHRDNGAQDLGLPLGMSFAAIVAQILSRTNGSKNQIPLDRLSLICTSAVKESVANVYGNRFDCFLMNFEKSFTSTLGTLRLINEASVAVAGRRKRSYQVPLDKHGNRLVEAPSIVGEGNNNCNSFLDSSSCQDAQGNCESPCDVEKFEDIPQITTMTNQIVLHGQVNHELACASHRFGHASFNQSILNTFEKSVVEQTRSNDLKTYEIGLIRRKIQLKESQLAVSSHANVLEKIKISMGISKASFKGEKLRNQMLDTRHADLLRRCIDLMVAGLIIMSCCLGYGTYIYSYQRITEVTSSCSVIPEESKSWWVPKQMASFSSGWLILRCHVVAFTRMFFGLAMIVVIAYSVFQRSAMATPTTMPVTFILLLGFICGIAGKLCVDTLGGSGLHWLLYWEAFCLLHFFANIFPSVLYQLLYGPITMCQTKAVGRIVPYWLRRIMFNLVLSVIYPALSGLLPFASLGDWKEHFLQRINHLIIGVESQE
ncbi:uncharacterized protein A4U43_C02F18840 [Asparagus officinalis]|uniref:Protein CPR-5 n=1 Tax=Asparagus officinalis TaxID=4686 RepID=A0A5P1FL39_ASPOF|nr:protein CPR-5 [Asparagus officinalis]ONK78443.1 uncharacterized protein A4U43_C02F18840 [Asparagus officinalis]